MDVEQAQHWNSRGHFFAAAAEAMRRILVEHARRKRSLQARRRPERVDLARRRPAARTPAEDLLALDEALDQLAAADPQAAELVKLRYFAGLTIEQAAELLGISPRHRHRHWAYARAWLHRQLRLGEPTATAVILPGRAFAARISH